LVKAGIFRNPKSKLAPPQASVTTYASREAHDMAVECMVQAGARPITTWVYVSELQRDWACVATAEKVTKLFAQRGGAFGQGLLWEWDLLNLKEGTR
jgi:hypothetical protein